MPLPAARRSFALLSFAALLASACAPPVAAKPAVSARLLVLAGAEAANVTAHRERVALLLNVAFRQLQRGEREAAKVPLRQVRATLQESTSLDEHSRMAAWVSLSQLWRGAGAPGSAREATAEGKRFLESLQPVARRAEYVRGLALEIRRLDGEAPAIALLRQGADWAAAIDDAKEKRHAYTAIAWDLFVCEDFDGGHGVLRRDADATWRSTTLTALAQLAGRSHSGLQSLQGDGLASLAMGARGPGAKDYDFTGGTVHGPKVVPETVRFGRPVSFDYVFMEREQR